MNGCGACARTKDMLENRAKRYPDVNISFIPGVGNPEVEKQMKKVGKEDFKTWPKIFLNGQFVGGSTDLENKLKHM